MSATAGLLSTCKAPRTPLYVVFVSQDLGKSEPGTNHQEHDLGAKAADHQRVRGGPHPPRRHRQEVGL